MKKPSSIPKAPDPGTSRVEWLDHSIPQRMVRCVICASETQEGSPDQMCWVCRRLKISAWRDVEQQLPAQE
jgi:hypothetical protein